MLYHDHYVLIHSTHFVIPYLIQSYFPEHLQTPSSIGITSYTIATRTTNIYTIDSHRNCSSRGPSSFLSAPQNLSPIIYTSSLIRSLRHAQSLSVTLHDILLLAGTPSIRPFWLHITLSHCYHVICLSLSNQSLIHRMRGC